MLPARKTISAATIILAISIAAFSASSCSKDDRGGKSTPPPEPPVVKQIKGDPASGKAVYEKHCHYCHGMKGYGDGAVGFALTPHPVNFVDDAKSMAKSDAALFKSITEGISRDIGGKSMFMPRWKEILSEKERWDALAYVRKLSEDGRKKKK